MEGKQFKLIASLILVMVISCDEPETVVTNYVHTDGSVTRAIEMRSINEKVNERFALSNLQVPFDSTWIVKDSCESDDKVDTIWVRRAVKTFKNADEINLSYKNDSGANKDISRKVSFKKTFKWFNTEYRFYEIIDKKLSFGYPVKDFLNDEELLYFYSPENVQEAKKNGIDSLKFKALSDSVNLKVEIWTARNLVSGWINEFSKLAEVKEGSQKIIEALKSHENELVGMISKNEDKFDSLWAKGIILKEYLGEAEYLKFKSEADTADENIVKQFIVNFKDYSVRIVMPGSVIGSNGFIDSSKVLLWPVKSDYFLTEPYQMWAESKIPNRWAWVISILFLVFVLTGVIIRVIKKG
jgi:hypothetical protein